MEMMNECEWVSVCCGVKAHYWVDDMCSRCMKVVAFECEMCVDGTHRQVTVGSLDCDPLSLHIMKAVGDMLQFYRGCNGN